jgi:hypothetical protein
MLHFMRLPRLLCLTVNLATSKLIKYTDGRYSARMMPAQWAADNVVEVLRDATKH